MDMMLNMLNKLLLVRRVLRLSLRVSILLRVLIRMFMVRFILMWLLRNLMIGCVRFLIGRNLVRRLLNLLIVIDITK